MVNEGPDANVSFPGAQRACASPVLAGGDTEVACGGAEPAVGCRASPSPSPPSSSRVSPDAENHRDKDHARHRPHHDLYKYMALVLLVTQTTATVLLMRMSLTRHDNDPFLKTTAVVSSEVCKVVLALVLCAVEQPRPFSFAHLATQLYQENIVQWRSAVLLCVPAGLYVLQNNLLFIAVQNLDSTKYQITYQLKILVTAMFAVSILGQKLSARKWASLFWLMAGVCLVQLNTGEQQDHHHQPVPAAATAASATPGEVAAAGRGGPSGDDSEYLGLIAVLAASCTSGFAGVYFEKILKGTPTSLWMRNVQLGIISIVVGLVGVHTKDGDAVRARGFFQGYTRTVWAVVLLQSFGGLMVAAVIKYADNIVKSFANSVSIVLTGVLSYYFMEDFHIGTNFVVGAPMVISAAFMYGASS